MRFVQASVPVICALVIYSCVAGARADDHKISTNGKSAASKLPELKPSAKNLGRKTEPISVSYWIELTRDGKSFRANNKSPFHSGDEIKIHVISNVEDGHACVILKSRNEGAGTVLFPDPKHGDDDRVLRKHDNVIPEFDPFVFDKDAGVEKVLLVVSRSAIDPTAYASSKGKPASATVQGVILVAMNPPGKKDLYPSNATVDYGGLPKDFIVPSGTTAYEPQTKDLFGAPKGFEPGQLIAYEPLKTGSRPKTHTVETRKEIKKAVIGKHADSAARPAGTTTKALSPYSKNDAPPGAVTVESKDASNTLAIDIALQHLQ